MVSRLVSSFLTIFILTSEISCQDKAQHASSTKQKDTTKLGNNEFFRQILELDEFKREEKRADSISKISKMPVKVSVEIIDSSFYEEDKGKNICLAFINEQYPYDRLVMYTVKYDKDKKKIISINREKKSFERSENLGAPEDLPLPAKQ